MKELEYPFDAELIRKKRIKLRKALLADESAKFVETRIAVLGGSTTSEIKNMLELFLLNFGIKPSFYESEYNKYYEDGMFDNPELAAFKPDIVYIHTSSRNITRWPAVSDRARRSGASIPARPRWMRCCRATRRSSGDCGTTSFRPTTAPLSRTISSCPSIVSTETRTLSCSRGKAPM